jgi:hypothetical protein
MFLTQFENTGAVLGRKYRDCRSVRALLKFIAVVCRSSQGKQRHWQTFTYVIVVGELHCERAAAIRDVTKTCYG